MAWHNEFRDWLTEAKSLENAQQVVNFLYTDSKDWSKESISALIGNMRHESSVNPNMYEYGYNWNEDRGFGLVQWTPRSKYWDWGAGNGYTEEELRSGDAQLDRIDYEVENNIQWIARESNFNGLTFKEFRTNSKDLSVDELTEAFTWGYERPNQSAGEESMPARKAFANKAFNDLDWSGGSGPGPDPEPGECGNEETIDAVLEIVGASEGNLLQEIADYFDGIDIPLEDILGELFKPYLYNMSDTYYSNKYIKATIIKNLVKLTLTGNFDGDIGNVLESLFENIDGAVVEEFNSMKTQIEALRKEGGDPDPPDPEPNDDMYFPVVKNGPGINFWKKENYSPGTIQYDMGYGTRTSGEFHAGYDIGSGGNSGIKVYAIRDCIITDIRQVSGGGYSVFMEHTSDDYHSMFLHLQQDSAVVNIGDKVKAGEQIAVMGNTGGNYAIHLHVEISPTGNFHTEENTINPQTYLKVTADNTSSLPSPS